MPRSAFLLMHVGTHAYVSRFSSCTSAHTHARRYARILVQARFLEHVTSACMRGVADVRARAPIHSTNLLCRFARPSVRRHIREQWRLIATGQSASSRQISRLHRLRLHHLHAVHCLSSCRKSTTTSPLSSAGRPTTSPLSSSQSRAGLPTQKPAEQARLA